MYLICDVVIESCNVNCGGPVGGGHRWAQSAMDRWIDTDTIDRSIDTIGHADHR
jgi:hypothetical protein